MSDIICCFCPAVFTSSSHLPYRNLFERKQTRKTSTMRSKQTRVQVWWKDYTDSSLNKSLSKEPFIEGFKIAGGFFPVCRGWRYRRTCQQRSRGRWRANIYRAVRCTPRAACLMKDEEHSEEAAHLASLPPADSSLCANTPLLNYCVYTGMWA